jgi:large subunit ribosomal protein L31
VKKEGHPDYHPVCFVDVSTGRKFLTRSTMRTKQKETIDGVEYYVVVRDVTSDSHPAFTGEKRFLDTAGRVEKFKSKFQRVRK